MTRKDLKALKKNLSVLITARHYKYYSQDLDKIAAVMGMSAKKIKQWMDTPEWLICCSYWGNRPKLGDLHFAERLWTHLVEKDEHIHLVEYPEKPRNSKYSEAVLAVEALIHSHLFCIDNLTEAEIQERLANEDSDGMKPTRYNGEDLENAYYYWVFPNKPEGLYSKVLARANVAGDLVIDFDGETCLVIIRHGRLTITRQVCDDVANVSDSRLLVCL